MEIMGGSMFDIPLGRWTPFGGIVGNVTAQIPELSKKKKKKEY